MTLPEWLTPSRWGLALRSALAAGVVVAIALALGALALLFVLHRTLLAGLDDATTTRAVDVAAALRTAAPTDIESRLFETDQRVALVQVIDSAGRVARSSEGTPGSPAIDVYPDTVDAPLHLVVTPGDDGADLRITTLGAPGIEATGTETKYAVIVAASEEPVEATLATVGGLLALGAPAIALVAAAATYRLVGRSLRSVERIRARVAAISSTDLGERVPVPLPRDEIAALARTMNDMLSRVEAGHAAQRRFVADASHELRSPLATLTTALEVADTRPEVLDQNLIRDTLLPEAIRMQLLVDDLLLLARADEHGLPLRVEDVDLDDVVDTEVRRTRTGVVAPITATVVPVRVHGDAGQLSRMVRNLIDNAVRYAATAVHVDVRPSGGDACLVVDDDGPGIPEADRTRVFERFVRLDGARSRTHGGSGLGLAIVAEIVAAHGGSVSIGQSAKGGTRVVVTLPAEQPSSRARS